MNLAARLTTKLLRKTNLAVYREGFRGCASFGNQQMNLPWQIQPEQLPFNVVRYSRNSTIETVQMSHTEHETKRDLIPIFRPSLENQRKDIGVRSRLIKSKSAFVSARSRSLPVPIIFLSIASPSANLPAPLSKTATHGPAPSQRSALAFNTTVRAPYTLTRVRR